MGKKLSATETRSRDANGARVASGLASERAGKVASELATERPVGSAQRGLLILDSNGKEVAASGIAADRKLASRIVSGWNHARRQQKRLFSVEGPDGATVVVVVLPSTDATVLVAMQRDGRDTLFEFVASVDFAGEILDHFLTNPFEALVVVDRHLAPHEPRA